MRMLIADSRLPDPGFGPGDPPRDRHGHRARGFQAEQRESAGRLCHPDPVRARRGPALQVRHRPSGRPGAHGQRAEDPERSHPQRLRVGAELSGPPGQQPHPAVEEHVRQGHRRARRYRRHERLRPERPRAPAHHALQSRQGVRRPPGARNERLHLRGGDHRSPARRSGPEPPGRQKPPLWTHSSQALPAT